MKKYEIREGKKLTEEHKRKLSLAHKGKKLSEETKNKISKKMRGKNHPMYGKHLSEETKRKQGKTRKILIKQGKINVIFKKGMIPWNKGKKLIHGSSFKKGHIPWNKGKPYPHSKEHRINSIKASLKACRLKPNKPEKFLINLIKKNNLPFNYVGDGKIILDGFCPDFLSKNPKYIIEIFGDYWHNRLEIIERDERRLKSYSKLGYKTLVIWEHEFENPDLILNKINKFIGK